MGVSENRGYSTLNSRILIIRTPKYGAPNFRKLPYSHALQAVCRSRVFEGSGSWKLDVHKAEDADAWLLGGLPKPYLYFLRTPQLSVF